MRRILPVSLAIFTLSIAAHAESPFAGRLCRSSADVSVSPLTLSCIETSRAKTGVPSSIVDFVWFGNDGKSIILGTRPHSVRDVNLGAPSAELRLRFTGTDTDHWPRPVTATVVSQENDVWKFEIDSDRVSKLQTLLLPQRGDYKVILEVGRHEPQQVTLAARPRGKADVTSLVFRRMPRIRGSVKDHATSKGVGGVRVAAGDVAVFTDAVGEFAIDVPSGQWPSSLAVSAPHYGDRWIPLPKRVGDTELPEVTLKRAGALRLTVAGISRADVEVSVGTKENRRVVSRQALTPETVFPLHFQNLAPNEYDLVIRGDRPLQVYAKAVEIEAEQTRDYTIEIDPISLHIECKSNGRELSNQKLMVYHADPEWKSEVNLDEAGRAKEEAWQETELTAYLTVSGNRIVFADKKRIDHIREQSWKIDLTERTIKGVVVDDAGKSVAGAFVNLRTEASGRASVKLEKTDSDGKFSFQYVAAGTHTVVASAPEYVDASTSFVLADEPEREIRLEIARGVRRTLVVTTPEGQPIAGAAVVDASTSFASKTGADGTVTVALKKNEQRIFFVIPREGSFAIEQITGKATDEPARITVPRGEVSLDVRANATTGDRVANIGLVLRYNGIMLPSRVLGFMTQQQGVVFKTGTDGSARLPSFPVGVYELWPVTNYATIDALYASPPPPAARLAAQPGNNLILLEFKRVYTP